MKFTLRLLALQCEEEHDWPLYDRVPGDGLRLRRAVLHPRFSQVSSATLPRDVASRTQRPAGRQPCVPHQRAPANVQLRARLLRLHRCLRRDHCREMCDTVCHIFPPENDHRLFMTYVVVRLIGSAIQVLTYSSVRFVERYRTVRDCVPAPETCLLVCPRQ